MESTKRETTLIQIKKAFVVGLRTLAVCLLFTACMAVGVALSGLDRVAKQGGTAQTLSQTPLQTPPTVQGSPPTPPRAQTAPSGLFIPFLAFSVCVGSVVSYLILRSSEHGWTLAGAMFVGTYGISTVVSQIESIVFLSSKLPHGMVRAIFVQGAIATALFAPLAVLVLGKWRAAMPAAVRPVPEPMPVATAAWRLAWLIIAFVFLYMFFGYYVAWQNPEVRKYYGGPEWPSFFAALKGNWLNSHWIYPLASFRALLYVAFVFPLIRMLRVARWESAMATALFLSAWTTMLLLPNPWMPASVARSHFWETLGFSLVFGILLGWLLNPPSSAIAKSTWEAP
jgi:hypothetical protein